MGITRLRMIVQALILVPPILFIIVYGYDNLPYVLTGVGLCLLLGWNIYRYKVGRSLFRYPVWALLIFSFFLYAFYGLGTKTSPQSFETLAKGERVQFDFSKPVSLKRICYYFGINETAHFTMRGELRGEWQEVDTYTSNFPFSFRWECHDVNRSVQRMELSVTKNRMMLGEVKFFSSEGLLPFSGSRKHVSDEQHIRPDTSYYGGMFFDEIYHSRTAYELLHGLRIYETTHPYLGKYLITPGIMLFGMTPYGWRFTNVLFAALFIVVMYYFGRVLFRSRFYAFVTAFLMTYSFMHLTQARIGLIDTFGVLFVLVSYYFLYRFIQLQRLRFLLLSGFFFGLASAVKWSAVFAALGFLLTAVYLLLSRYPLKERFSGYRLLLYGILSYGILAGSVYLFSFIDIFLRTGSLQSNIDYQFHMYDYHSRLISSHPYSSPWWSWPVDYKPMCYSREIHDGMFRSITAFGNPAIFWMGTLSLAYLLYSVIKQRSLEGFFILLVFSGLYLPYIFVGRLMFIYHFYYAVPFLILSLVYMIRDLHKRGYLSLKFAVAYLVVVSVLFLGFYPVLSGYAVPKIYVDNVLRWFPWWWL